MRFPDHYVTKTIPLKFMGIDLKFKLSHALFSSNRIDDGTMLLLKTLAQQKAVPETGKVLDAGCGVGPLAIAIKKHSPGLSVFAHDRLALACSFTTENARLNQAEVQVNPGLLMQSEDGPFDLIVSNLPAKAGKPVLADSLLRASHMLKPQGLAAIVIVAPLAEWAKETLSEQGAQIVFMEDTRDYWVIHYKNPGESQNIPTLSASEILSSYLRAKFPWAGPRGKLVQQCLWGLPNFDGLDYRHEVALELISKAKWEGKNLVWEPVMGHMASAMAQISGTPPSLAANDWLSLQGSSLNLGQQGFLGGQIIACPIIGSLQALPAASLNGLIVNIHSEPEIKWVSETLETILHLVKPGATVLVTGTSTDLARFCSELRDLRVVHDKKYRGWRAVMFQRKGDSK